MKLREVTNTFVCSREALYIQTLLQSATFSMFNGSIGRQNLCLTIPFLSFSKDFFKYFICTGLELGTGNEEESDVIHALEALTACHKPCEKKLRRTRIVRAPQTLGVKEGFPEEVTLD